MIATRRVRVHSALFGALLGVAALLAGLGVGLVGQLDSAALDGVRGGVAELTGSQAELRFDAPKSDDTAKQTAHADAIIARELRRGRASVPVTVTRTDADDGDDFIWTVRADASRITPADLPVLARAGSRIHSAMLNDPAVGAQGVEKSGTLDAQAKALAARVAPLAGIEPVPLLLVAAIGLVTLAELGRLLDGVRARETALLRSRGASAARVGRTTALEVLVVAGVGALAGAGVATALLVAFGSHPLTWPLLGSIVLAVVAAAVVLVTGIAYNSARLAFRRDTADDSGRARRLAAPGLVVLLLAAAGLSLARYLSYGSPLSPTSAGERVDPVAVLAPALCLAAVAVLCLVAFPPVARLVERAATRGDGARTALVAGQLARRARLTASPLVLIALAGGGLVVAGCYTPTWQAAASRTALLHSGSDLVVTGARAGDAARIARLSGVRAASGAIGFSWQDAAGADLNLSALGAAGVRSAASPAGGAVNTGALADSLSAKILGTSIGDDATGLDVDVASSGAPAETTFTVLDSDGVETRLSVSADADGHTHVALPQGTGRTIVAVDIALPAVPLVVVRPVAGDPSTWYFQSQHTEFRLVSVTATTADGAATPVDLGSGWQKDDSGSTGQLPADFTQVGTFGFNYTEGFVFGADGFTVRYLPTGTQTVPVVISQPLAVATHARVGADLSFDLGDAVGGTLNAKVAAIVPAVPGAQGDEAMLAALPAMQAQRIEHGADALPVDRVWVRTGDAGRVAAEIRGAVPGASVTGPAIEPGSRVLDAVPVALWLGMSGGALLALIALAAVAGELLRVRADELGVLRALGFTPRALSRLRMSELVTVAVAAGVGAAIAGAVVSALVVPGLARVAIENPFDGLPLPLLADPLGLGVAAAAMALVVAAVVAVYGAHVARQARTTTPREGTG